MATISPFVTASDGNGGVIIIGYTGSGGSVTIPSTISGLSVTGIGNAAFQYATSVTSVTVPSGVTSVGQYAFKYCTNLTHVTLPNSVTSLGDAAFLYCTHLTSVNFPSTISSLPPALFYGCSSLASVTIPNTISSIGTGAFEDCSGLTSVTLPANLTGIAEYAFSGCTSLPGITIPNTVTSVGGYAFLGCTGLTSAVFQGTAPLMGPSVFNSTASGFTVDYSNGASGFTSPTWTDSSSDSYPASGSGTFVPVPIISLSGNLALGSAKINTTASGILTISNTGSAALVVSSITYPSGFSGSWSGTIAAGGSQNVVVTFSPTTATAYAGTLTVNSNAGGGINTVTVTGTGVSYAVAGISLSGNLTFGNFTPNATTTGTLTITNPGGAALVVSAISYPSGFSGSWSGTIAAGGSQNVTVTFSPPSAGTYSGNIVVSSNASNGVNTFAVGGTGVPYTVTTSNNQITITGYTGSGGVVVIPGTINGLPVTALGTDALYFSAITSVTIPNSVTTLGQFAFYDCTSLTSVTLGNGVTDIGQEAFDSCTNLSSVTIPNSVSDIENYAFYQCTNLASAIFQGNAPTTMGYGVFSSTAGGFTVDYYNGATGFTSSTPGYWRDSYGDLWPAVDLGTNPLFPSITSSATASGTYGTVFGGYTIVATNSPTNFNATGLPLGLTINASGVISGTPTQTGTFSVGLSATNGIGTGTATLTLTINKAPLTLSVNSGFSSTYGTTPTDPGIAVTGGALLNGDTLMSLNLGDDFSLTSASNAGTYQVNVTGASGVVNYAVTTQSANYTINQATQTITFTFGNLSYPSAPVTLTATASSGLTSFTYGFDSGPASLAGNQLTINGTGAVKLTASQAGNVNYLPASLTQTFTVTQATYLNFAAWESNYPALSQTAAGATPLNDGVSNLLKYVYDIDPLIPMTTSDKQKLADVVTTSTTQTLTYNLYALIDPTVKVQVETSPDLVNWTVVTSTNGTITTKVLQDGDSTVTTQVPLTSPRQFIRLHVVSP